jgi:hypothetical protein
MHMAAGSGMVHLIGWNGSGEAAIDILMPRRFVTDKFCAALLDTIKEWETTEGPEVHVLRLDRS